MESLREKCLKFCQDHQLVDYYIDDDGIRIENDLRMTDTQLTEFPVPFKHVSGDVRLDNNQLNSFKNFPKFIGGKKLNLSKNNFSSLIGLSDIQFSGSIYLHENPIQSFKGFPTHFYGDNLTLSNCGLTDSVLEELKLKVVGNTFCLMVDNNFLKKVNLKNISFLVKNNEVARQKNFRQLLIFKNQIDQIEFIPEDFDHINLDMNNISDLSFLKKIPNMTNLSLMSNQISSFKNINFSHSLKGLKLSLHFNPISSVDELAAFNEMLNKNNHGTISKIEDLKKNILSENKKKIIMESL